MPTLKITHLEMTSPDALKPCRCADPRFRVLPATVKQWELNRFLYLLVGAEWSWTDKRDWSPEQWQAHVLRENLHTFVAHFEGSIAGYFELEQQPGGAIEVGILGLTPQFIGKGFGRVLVTEALERAWQLGARRVWLHTCNLDHPAALPNYLARGLKPFRVETA